MKTIKDSVHDHIAIDGVALDLLDTEPVQRLRHIRQLGTVHLVYPAANHTRFEHSIGVYSLACQALKALNVAGNTADHVKAAALLHDVGHAPYSHNLEALLARHTGRFHDDVASLVTEGIIATVLESYGLDPGRVAGLIAGEGRYGQLISGELDVDRMDYLIRDAHHTGVPYGTIDHARLIQELRFVDGTLALGPGNIEAAESLLVARALMNPTVYNHHVARISKTMIRRATERLLETGAQSAATIQQMDDHALISALRSCPESVGLTNRLLTRNLYKRAVWLELRAVPEWIQDAAPSELRTLEEDIAHAADVPTDVVLIDRPPEPEMQESTSHVVVNGSLEKLGDRSPLVRTLETIQTEQWRFGIYAPSDLRERVASGATEILDIDTRFSDGVGRSIGEYARLDDFSY